MKKPNKFKLTNIKGKRPRVVVGMSGGVDSSVSAYLLKNMGFDVIGIFIETWHPDGFPCTEKEDRRDAMRVAARLGIKLYIANAREEYKKFVADEMLREYKLGRTPNPDILCNRFVKFHTLFKTADKLEADFVATGHYAKIKILNNNVFIAEPKDKEKDQTYFLWAVEKKQLDRIIFPLENLTKKEVRIIAKKINIPVASKKDSQGICFLGPLDLKKYLNLSIKMKKGKVVDLSGKQIGTHNGVWFYTEGERHGLSIKHISTDSRPMYILKKDVPNNILVVGPQNLLAGKYTVELADVSIFGSGFLDVSLSARFRYRQAKQKITLYMKGKKWFVDTNVPTPIAPGQSVVFYHKDILIGGAVIKRVV